MKFASLIIGVCAIIVALMRFEIVPLIIFAFSLSGCVIGIPLFFGVMRWSISLIQYYSCLFFSCVSLILTLIVLNLKGMYPSSIAIISGLTGFVLPMVFAKLKRSKIVI